MIAKWPRGLALLLLVPLLAVGCRTTPSSRDIANKPTPTTLDHAESDAFDNLFESALLAGDPVIFIRTEFEKPEWGPRLNAWIAAWNRGGPARDRTVRGQAPVPKIVIDEGSIREFRLLVSGLLDRVEVLAQSGPAWWAEERQRSRRVGLLLPYNLRFHMDVDGRIQLVFFHGKHAEDYPNFVRQLTGVGEEWSRTVVCSQCGG